MAQPIFDPRKSEYKSPYGALPVGARLRLCLRPPQSLGILRACLVLELEQEGKSATHPMVWQSRRQGTDEYVLSLTLPQAPGLIWYHFRLESPGGPLFLDQDGLGHTAGAPFQLTVYAEPGGKSDWFSDGVLYQIFPDRFARQGLPDLKALGKPGRLHENWADTPDFLPNAEGKITNSDFFGGSLAGIREKLPYLAELGVTVLYLNPIFQAASNHRYDTGDYRCIDPLLGTEADFSALCSAAEALGIRVLLDGVFSHTGDDSVYFNKYGRYNSLGAYQSPDSPYAGWYSFSQFPDGYAAWWGIDTLPEVREMDPGYLDFIAGSEDCVIRHWLRAGAVGWRLDVADELPDDFIDALGAAARLEKPDAFLLGEVWEDATNKISYGARRRYLWGGALDGVMNYPFRNALLAFLLGGRAEDFVETMERLRENYPPKAFYNCMNFLGTHDTPRILTLLGVEKTPESREARAAYRLSPAEYRQGAARLRIAATILFTFPGVPTIFYGDEAGMQGFEDPFNRGAYPWGAEDTALRAHFARLAALRKGSAVLRRGDIRYHIAAGPVLIFSRNLGTENCVTLVNRGDTEQSVMLAGRSHLLPPCSAEILEDINRT